MRQWYERALANKVRAHQVLFERRGVPRRRPSLNLGRFISAVVIRNQMDIQSRLDAAIEMIKKAEKFLMTMARFAHSDDLAIQHLDCRKQGGSAVVKIVVAVARMKEATAGYALNVIDNALWFAQ